MKNIEISKEWMVQYERRILIWVRVELTSQSPWRPVQLFKTINNKYKTTVILQMLKFIEKACPGKMQSLPDWNTCLDVGNIHADTADRIYRRFGTLYGKDY